MRRSPSACLQRHEAGGGEVHGRGHHDGGGVRGAAGLDEHKADEDGTEDRLPVPYKIPLMIPVESRSVACTITT